jgi:deazaflavin-dependent oxidoreductase (nitroreductase family)
MAALKVVLLHHKGAKSGVERVNPVAYREVGDNIAVFASNAGRKANPDWYYNLVAHPETVVELGTERFPVRARVARGGERTEIWEAQKVDAPMFADYEKTASRDIPVVILERT